MQNPETKYSDNQVTEIITEMVSVFRLTTPIMGLPGDKPKIDGIHKAAIALQLMGGKLTTIDINGQRESAEGSFAIVFNMYKVFRQCAQFERLDGTDAIELIFRIWADIVETYKENL